MDMGEDIEWDDYGGVFRVRNLSLSRAIGDRFAKPVVSGDVEIKLFPLKEELVEKKVVVGDSMSATHDFVLLASDGLWDVMTSQVSQSLSLQCYQLISTCKPTQFLLLSLIHVRIVWILFTNALALPQYS
jgi:serine/threonine protein phosphatase PrpC